MENRGSRLNVLTSYILTAVMVLSLFGIGTVPAYAVGSKYDIQWFSSYGGTHYDEGFSVIAVEDGFVYTGTVSDDKGLEYTFLVKANEEGSTVWEKRFGGIFHSSGRSVSRTADGGYIIVGTSKTYMESFDKVYLIKTDGEGNLQWEQKLDLSDQGYTYSKRQGFSVKQAADGGYIIAGTIIQGDSSDALLIKTGSLGSVQWAQLYGGEQWDWFYDVEVVEDGYIAGGFKEINNRSYEYLIKVGGAGELIWEHAGSSPGAHIKDLMVASDGSIMATGYRISNISLLKFGSQGIYQWGRSYDTGIGYGIGELPNGDFVIAGNGNVLGIKPSGAKSWAENLAGKAAGLDVYVKSVVIRDSGTMVFAGFVNQANSDACIFQLGADRASLGVSTPNVLAGGSVYLFAPVYLSDGQPDRTATAEVKVKVKKGDEELEVVPLSDGNFYPSDDFEDHDGIYSGWIDIPKSVTAPGQIHLELLVDGALEDTRTVDVIDDPSLVVLTHYEVLYEEFLDTGTAVNLDEDDNRLPDYFDLMVRISNYAQGYKGVVLDVNEEISKAKGWTKDYSELIYDQGDASPMAVGIDALMNGIFSRTGSKLKNVAIIGDDEVIPFYRKTDTLYGLLPPVTNESGYVPSDMKGKNWGNPTLIDSSDPYIMTDVPFGTWVNVGPDDDHFPLPVAGVGRIFADRPSILIKMIDGYETPINLIPKQSRAAIFSLDKDPVKKIVKDGVEKEVEGVDFPRCAKNTITSVLGTKYTRTFWTSEPMYNKGLYYWYEGTVRNWGGSDVIRGIEKAELSFIWSHATHINESSQNKPDLTHNTFRSLLDSPGHMLINAGCHSGYTVSHNNSMNTSESYLPYDQSMVKQIISKQIAYMAPTTYGYSSNLKPTDHDLLSKVFLAALLDGTSGTVGDKWMKAYADYRKEYKNIKDNYSVYAIYGMGYYGLPTQPVVASETALKALDTSLSKSSVASDDLLKSIDSPDALKSLSFNAMEATSSSITESRHMDVSIAMPEPMLTSDDDDNVLLEIPGGSAYTMTKFAPLMPLIQKTYILPAGSTVDSVSLKSSVERAEIGPLQLQRLYPVNKTTGRQEGSFELDGPYPAERFTWSSDVREDGVYVTLMVAPVQYDSVTKKVTVLSNMEFDIAYTTPVSDTNITEVIVNHGSTVNVEAYDIPIKVKIDSDSTRETLLQWQVRDNSGLVIESGTRGLDLAVGDNELELAFDTEGWTPGDKALTLLLREDAVMASWFGNIAVSGLYADLIMEQRVYDPADSIVAFRGEILDEGGAVISGLTIEDFDIEVDGDSVTGLLMEEAADAAGSYQFSFPVGSVTEDIHELTLSCVKAGNRSTLVSEVFVVREDTAAPEIIRTDPAQYEAGVAPDALISITFNEALLEGETFEDIGLIKEGEDEDVPALVETVIASDSLILTPEVPLELNSVYKVIIPSEAVKDSKGNAFPYTYQLQFVTYTEPDLAAPVVESTLPSDGGRDFPSNAAIKVDFSESIGAGPNAAEIQWLADGTPVAFDITYYANQLILAPKLPVPYSAACSVVIPAAAIQDLSGNPLESEYTFAFTIEEAEDSQGPLLLSAMPEHEMTGVLTDALITLRFDETVLEGSEYSGILLAEVNDGISGDPLAYTVELQRDTLTLTPELNFKEEQEYLVTVPAGAVEDLMENPLEEPIEIGFTTGGHSDDDAGPDIDETAPYDDAEGVLRESNIYVYFDEAIQEGDEFANIALLDMSEGGEGTAVAFSASIEGRTLILEPSVALAYERIYKVRIPAGGVADLTGNPSGAAVFGFTTERAPDTRPPGLVSTSPEEGGIDVSQGAQIAFTFDELIQAGDEYARIRITAGSEGENIDFTKSINGKQLILLPKTAMPLSSVITVYLPENALADLLRNQADSAISLSFTIIEEDIKDESPPVTEHSVSGTLSPTGWYTSAVKVTLTARDDGSGVALTSWSLDGVSWNDYLGFFTVDRQGEVRVYYKSEDRDGNVEAVKTFAVMIDTVSPKVSSSSPGKGAANVPLNQSITVTFSENITGGSAYGDIVLKCAGTPVPILKVISGRTMTITPVSMTYDTAYTLTIPEEAAIDVAGNSQKKEYILNFTTKSQEDGGSGGVGGGGGGALPAGDIPVTGSINGKAEKFVEAGDREDGDHLIPIVIDGPLLDKLLESSEAGSKVNIKTESSEGFRFTGLTGRIVKDMELRGAVLEIETGLAGYTLPAELLDIDSVAERLGEAEQSGEAEQRGENVDLQDIQVNITIASPSADVVQNMESAARRGGYSLLMPPVEFVIECVWGEKLVGVTGFKSPVVRQLPLPAGLDPDKITTAVVVERDGRLRHVPTRIFQIGKVYYAEITSLTNSVYTLIWNPVEFGDMEGHWAKASVNNLGSRLVIAGIGKGIYEPDRPVSRAELAAIIVRALGVEEQAENTIFTDTLEGDWFLGAVNAAAEYGIISGYSDDTFRPMQKVTREESFVMISRAMKLASSKVGLVIEPVAEPEDVKEGSVLDRFTDRGELSPWSEASVAFAVQNGLVSGYAGKLKPKDSITRAEAAVIVEMMLKNAVLINQ